MQRKSLCVISMLSFVAAATAFAQAAPTGQKTLAATLGLYAFPSQGQTAEVQSTDESQCYAWAVQNTGTDPFELQKKAQAQTQQIQGQASQQAAATQQQAAAGGKGAGARGAVGGAAVGALVGGIGGNAGRGAAVGAATGVVVGRSRARRGQQQAEAQAAAVTQQAESQVQQVQAATAEQMDGFRKAFSVCLEAKHYLVKF
jgi:hypothetical protein